MIFSLSGPFRGVQSSCRACGGYKNRGPGPTQAPETQEAAGPLLPGAGVRAGAPLQAAEVPVRPGEGPPGRGAQTHPDPGEDLVPEPPLQDEERPGRRCAAGPGDGAASGAAQARCSDPGAGRETFSHLLT